MSLKNIKKNRATGYIKRDCRAEGGVLIPMQTFKLREYDVYRTIAWQTCDDKSRVDFFMAGFRNKRATLRSLFSFFLLQQECEYDHIEVRSKLSENELRKHGTFCGTHLPPVLTSEGNVLRIEFSSDNSVQKTGFAAVYFTGKFPFLFINKKSPRKQFLMEQ